MTRRARARRAAVLGAGLALAAWGGAPVPRRRLASRAEAAEFAPQAPRESEAEASIFDGNSAAAPGKAAWRAWLRPLAVPPVEGRSLPGAPAPPDDLARAGARWGNAAQIAVLGRVPPEPGRPFTFAVIGDAEPGRFPWERIFLPARDAFRRQLRSIQDRRPAFILQLGDFVSRGTAGNYRGHVRLLEEEVRLPMLTVIGNHDRSRPNGAADKTLYGALYGKGDFYFDFGGWRLIGLDTSDRKLTRAQLGWLRGVLDTPSHKLVFTHVPPAYLRGSLRSQGFAGLSEEAQGPEGYLRDFVTGYFEEGSAEFGELVASRRVDRVYMGHIHAFGLATYRGVPHILSGGGGSPLYPMPRGYPTQKMAHFILLEAGPGGIVRETVVPLEGPEFALRF